MTSPAVYTDTDSMHVTEIPQSRLDFHNIMNESGKAYSASLTASANALDRSPLDPWDVAIAVADETSARMRKEIATRDELARRPVEKLKTPSNLGCYVEGVLKFQSKEHDAVHAYADRKMRERYSVWVAPVGSFVAS